MKTQREKDVPFLSTDQMIKVDRAMIENYHIELIQMMENAGQALAHLSRSRFFNGDPRGNRVVVLVGTGGNGGGALVCARRLHNYGATVQVFATKPDDQFTPVPAHQLEILQRSRKPDRGCRRYARHRDCYYAVSLLLADLHLHFVEHTIYWKRLRVKES